MVLVYERRLVTIHIALMLISEMRFEYVNDKLYDRQVEGSKCTLHMVYIFSLHKHSFILRNPLELTNPKGFFIKTNIAFLLTIESVIED